MNSHILPMAMRGFAVRLTEEMKPSLHCRTVEVEIEVEVGEGWLDDD